VAEQLAALGWAITKVPTRGHGHGHGHGNDGLSGPSAGGGGSTAGAHTVSVGVVQTAYANGASTAYITSTLHLPVPMAKTGVKFVHHAAAGYDVGIYFEANGHGTVLFSPELLAALRALDAAALSPAAATARDRLLAASLLINQAIGDAISDALFVEAVLTLKGWSVSDWDGIYEDLPSRQLKLAVADRTAIHTTEDETAVTAPAALQAAIDALCRPVPSGRAFVRPSGTEDVVRVYAEAANQEAADALAAAVADAAYRLAGGVGGNAWAGGAAGPAGSSGSGH
jgi:phosphoacetylglucosamine mutase